MNETIIESATDPTTEPATPSRRGRTRAVSDAARPAVALPRRNVTVGVQVVRGAFTRPGHKSRTIEHVQRALTEARFDPGPVDGVAGPRTRRAFAALNEKLGLPTRSVETAALAALGFDIATS